MMDTGQSENGSGTQLPTDMQVPLVHRTTEPNSGNQPYPPPAGAGDSGMGKATRWWMYLPILGLLILCVGVLIFFSTSSHPQPTELVPVSVGGVRVMAGIADSDSERAQGLSRRPSLPHDEGLLFIFPKPSIYSFWMKEMNFPIDILWFDENKKLIDVTAALDPSTYPQSFGPQQPAQYVLEVNAGFVEEKKINLGAELSF